MQLSQDTLELLKTLEESIDPETEDDYLAKWERFLAHKDESDIFDARRKSVKVLPYTYRNVHINDAIADPERMLVSELEPVLRAVQNGRHVLGVRANYGTGIMSSVFGCEKYIMPRQQKTLPTTRPLGPDALDRLLDAGVPDLDNGFGKDVFRMGEYFLDVFSHYPKIQKYVQIYHPDTQGPLDICELLMGSDMFYLMYDEPEKLGDLLALITKTYRAFLDRWYRLVPRKTRMNAHWASFIHHGSIVLREDSAMNISPDQYRQFGLPYDTELLRAYDGGVIHFCGRGDHYIDIIRNIPGLYGINMSQPQYNDMEKIYRNTVDAGIQLLGFSAEQAQKDVTRPNAFRHNLAV